MIINFNCDDVLWEETLKLREEYLGPDSYPVDDGAILYTALYHYRDMLNDRLEDRKRNDAILKDLHDRNIRMSPEDSSIFLGEVFSGA